jgi:hypothetical protein
MRDVEVIDQELALLAVVRAALRREGGRPSSGVIDELLDERLDARLRPDAVHGA